MSFDSCPEGEDGEKEEREEGEGEGGGRRRREREEGGGRRMDSATDVGSREGWQAALSKM